MILYLNAEVGGLSIRLKKKNEKRSKLKNPNENNNNDKKLNIIAKLGFEPRSFAWKASVIATGESYHMDS